MHVDRAERVISDPGARRRGSATLRRMRMAKGEDASHDLIGRASQYIPPSPPPSFDFGAATFIFDSIFINDIGSLSRFFYSKRRIYETIVFFLLISKEGEGRVGVETDSITGWARIVRARALGKPTSTLHGVK